MDTSVGDAFIYGDLVAVNPVGYPEIGYDYLSVTRVTEEYTRHTRIVTERNSNGSIRTRTETYWTWDEIKREKEKVSEVIFCGSKFKYSQFNSQYESYIKTIEFAHNKRYVFYGCPSKLTGTVFAFLSNKTIKGEAIFYKNRTIEATINDLTSNDPLIAFWIFWIILIIGSVYGFYYLENKWLE